jgi:predicted nuclease with TOPRIM domain
VDLFRPDQVPIEIIYEKLGIHSFIWFKSIKLKPDATSVKTKLFHGRKVTTVNARDIEYMECEVIDNRSHIKELSRRLQRLHKKKKKHRQEIKQLKQQVKKERKNKTFQLQTVTSAATVRKVWIFLRFLG